jgi:hypothetical protein
LKLDDDDDEEEEEEEEEDQNDDDTKGGDVCETMSTDMSSTRIHPPRPVLRPSSSAPVPPASEVRVAHTANAGGDECGGVEIPAPLAANRTRARFDAGVATGYIW